MTCFAEIWRPGPKSPWWVFVAFSCKPKAGRRRHIPQQVGRVVTEEVGHCIPSGAASPIPTHLCARFAFLQQENREMQLKPRHTRSCVQMQLQLLEWTYIAFVSNLKTTHLELTRPQHKKLKSIPAFWRYYSLYYLYWGKKSGSPREPKKDQGTPCPWVPSWWASASPRSRIPRPLGWPSIRSCPGWLAHEEVCDLPIPLWRSMSMILSRGHCSIWHGHSGLCRFNHCMSKFAVVWWSKRMPQSIPSPRWARPTLVNFCIEPCKPSTNWMRRAGSSQQLRKICCTTPGLIWWEHMGAAAWYDWVKSPILTDKLTTQTSKLGIFVGQPLENIAWGPSFMIVLQSYPAFWRLQYEPHVSATKAVKTQLFEHARIPLPAASQERSASCGRKDATNKVRPGPKQAIRPLWCDHARFMHLHFAGQNPDKPLRKDPFATSSFLDPAFTGSTWCGILISVRGWNCAHFKIIHMPLLCHFFLDPIFSERRKLGPRNMFLLQACSNNIDKNNNHVLAKLTSTLQGQPCIT